ncbi:MAG: transposase [Xenococcaceae cyanobacterium]
MKIAQKNATRAKVPTLAQLYLEGDSAEISGETIAQLCDWLMGEFQNLPLNLQFSDDMRYDNVAEMFSDIDRGHLWVSADSYDSAIYPNPIYGFIFQGMHDYDHYLTNSDFSLEGEITAYKAAAKRAPSLEIQKILYSEIVLRSALRSSASLSAAHLCLGHTPNPKLVFL